MACPSALYLPIQNVTVNANTYVQARGIDIGIGTPAQHVAVVPDFGQNNTRVPSWTSCDSSPSELDCINEIGGLYNAANSSTFVFSTATSTNGSRTGVGGDYFNDNLLVNNSTIYGQPLLSAALNNSQGFIGLGVESVFLDSMVNATLAPSRYSGMWFGSASTANPIDGSLIIGGYDANKRKGESNFTMFSSCRACARVTGFTYNDDAGETELIDTEFWMSHTPWSDYVRVPTNLANKFANVTNAIWDAAEGAYKWNYAISGTITVTLANGYTSTIPASEFALPPSSVNANGIKEPTASTELISMVRANTSSGTVAWGAPWLAMNYIFLDPVIGSFGLSPVTAQTRNSPVLVHSLCSEDANQQNSTNTTDQPPGSSDQQTGNLSDGTNTSNGATSTSNKSTNTGAIAGGVVGGVAGLALIVLAVFLFMRRRRKQKPAASALPSMSQNDAAALHAQAAELPPKYMDHPPAQEMATSRPVQQKQPQSQPVEMWAEPSPNELESSTAERRSPRF
ncbi:hypothetical protein LTR64_005191 [Lithohypha guttulata]|uniref:uncharacterized protein n=1 Tax=Lithohypha guttulata TaxID=1690604 RepID=UPI002DE15F88|nr:hypothetical protein LTR51_003015 [Lithohypha guttulata]